MSRAFGFWLDLVCIMFVGAIIFSFFFNDGKLIEINLWTNKSKYLSCIKWYFILDTYGGHVGLAITQALGLVGFCQYGMRQSAELQDQMTSVERVLEYTNIPQEPALETPPGFIRSLFIYQIPQIYQNIIILQLIYIM